MNDIIVRAINSRRLLRFYYDGHLRVVQPAVLGMHASTENLTLKAYQVQGSSKSRVVPFWSSFIVSRIERAEELPDSFGEDPPGYNPLDSQITRVVAQL